MRKDRLVKAPKPESRNVKNNLVPNQTDTLSFSFEKFKGHSINIKNEFNNHFKDEKEFIRKINILLCKALPLLSAETSGLFKDRQKMEALHLHKINGKSILLEQIFKAYNYSEKEIDDIIEGEDVYQFELPFENGATRIIFQKIGSNLISFLFLDPNHHIYFDKQKAGNTLFYKYCPINENGDCQRLRLYQDCFAFSCLDYEKLKQSYGYDYNPEL